MRVARGGAAPLFRRSGHALGGYGLIFHRLVFLMRLFIHPFFHGILCEGGRGTPTYCRGEEYHLRGGRSYGLYLRVKVRTDNFHFYVVAIRGSVYFTACLFKTRRLGGQRGSELAVLIYLSAVLVRGSKGGCFPFVGRLYSTNGFVTEGQSFSAVPARDRIAVFIETNGYPRTGQFLATSGYVGHLLFSSYGFVGG